MPQQRGRRRLKPLVDGYDQIEICSIDSFPASDPPGWIDAKAKPCESETEQASPGRTTQQQ
jgi:hypothetical protein